MAVSMLWLAGSSAIPPGPRAAVLYMSLPYGIRVERRTVFRPACSARRGWWREQAGG